MLELICHAVANIERFVKTGSGTMLEGFPKCKCGDEGKYQNMVCGEFVWTCTKYGCANDKPTLTTSSAQPLNSDQWLAKHGRDLID